MLVEKVVSSAGLANAGANVAKMKTMNTRMRNWSIILA
jgi:hypothetical protein